MLKCQIMGEFRGGATIFPALDGSTVFLHKATVSVSYSHEVSRRQMDFEAVSKGSVQSARLASLDRLVHEI